jgi:hypothetical protein
LGELPRPSDLGAHLYGFRQCSLFEAALRHIYCFGSCQCDV